MNNVPDGQARGTATLGNRFASLFADARARAALAAVGARTRLPTFNLSTTSLRHLNMWFDRLHDINRGRSRAHGNYFSDPATIGLVDASARPRVLTQAGQAYLGFRATLRNNPPRSEYELLKIIYFSGYQQPGVVRGFLAEKRNHLASTLEQFTPTPSRQVFLTHPRLLVVAELISGFPGAIPGLIRWPERDLLDLDGLGEEGFKSLCDGPHFPPGLRRLCRRIGSDYTRAEERRLHYLVSMALLTIGGTVPSGRGVPLTVPLPFANLLTEIDIYTLHAQYTSDVNVWFDGVSFQISSSFGAPRGIPPAVPTLLQAVALRAQTGAPAGIGSAPPTDHSRRARWAARRTRLAIVIDPVLSERAEDLAEERVLQAQYGARLIRAGHRSGERIALPDGMVPGADFYVLNDANAPVEFVEIKSVVGNLPFEVVFTRAEYLRALRCAQSALAYRLILVDIASARFYEVSHFGACLAALQLSEAIQFSFQIVP